MYFVHSYEFVPEDKNVITATTDYSSDIVCSVEREDPYVSKNLSILKYSVPEFIESNKSLMNIINEIKDASIEDGGSGAFYIFLKKNREKFDVIIGMYHDQVLTPLKTLYEYNAINITLGLPFIRVSPDHGPNERMLGKNLSNPLSLIRAIKFLDSQK